jgi:hypothetical protein
MFSETSVLSTVSRYSVPEGIYNWYRLESISEDSMLFDPTQYPCMERLINSDTTVTAGSYYPKDARRWRRYIFRNVGSKYSLTVQSPRRYL